MTPDQASSSMSWTLNQNSQASLSTESCVHEEGILIYPCRQHVLRFREKSSPSEIVFTLLGLDRDQRQLPFLQFRYTSVDDIGGETV